MIRTASLSGAQQAVLVILRTLIGWHFTYEGLYKLRLPGWSPSGEPLAAWTATGFLKGATGPLAPLFGKMLDMGMAHWMDRFVMIGLFAVGLSLMLGLLTRWGCLGALFFLSLFYLLAVPVHGLPHSGAEGNYLLVNKTLIEAGAVLVLLAFGTGRIAGLDRFWNARGDRTGARVASLNRGARVEGNAS
jgi:thiosulfate dehydrogenase (quinone) large subunit